MKKREVATLTIIVLLILAVSFSVFWLIDVVGSITGNAVADGPSEDAVISIVIVLVGAVLIFNSVRKKNLQDGALEGFRDSFRTIYSE